MEVVNNIITHSTNQLTLTPAQFELVSHIESNIKKSIFYKNICLYLDCLRNGYQFLIVDSSGCDRMACLEVDIEGMLEFSDI